MAKQTVHKNYRRTEQYEDPALDMFDVRPFTAIGDSVF